MVELGKDCLFCKTIRGEVPSYTVFENDDIKAFLDISQVTKGHTLIISKKHLVSFFDCNQEDATRSLQYTPAVAQATKKSNPTVKGLNVEVDNGEIAEQVVMHLHIHLIPRRNENDPIPTPHVNNANQYLKADYQVVINAIENNL